MDVEKPGIVSSSHLAECGAGELSEFEFGLIIAANAFQRWIGHCMAASGRRDLSFIDILVLHNVNHRDRPKRIADICFTLNIEDTHLVSYALKKLARARLVVASRRGKETFHRTTPAGTELCRAYARTRRHCLLEGADFSDEGLQRLAEAARLLRQLSGTYDHAGRAAASL